MGSEDPLTTDLVEGGYAYNEWDVDTEEEEAPRRERFHRWLTAELAEAEKRGAVKALREAAEDLERTTVHWSNSGEDSRSAWLRRRADKEEQG